MSVTEQLVVGAQDAQPEAAGAMPSGTPSGPRTDRSMPARVGDIVGQHGTVLTLGSTLLPDVTDLLIESDRSAAAVVDDEGCLLGVITENDMVQAYSEGLRWNYMVPASVWLRSGRARFPSSLTHANAVQTATPLCEAAEKMWAQALNDAAACRHLIVRDERSVLRGILSSLDLARALCSVGTGMEEVDRMIGSATVAEIMKPRAALPTCNSNGTLAQALYCMIDSRQNCVLIVDSDAKALGVVTPRDALRAFSEHVRLDVAVGHWLRGVRSSLLPRTVRPGVLLADAARAMASGSIHHLVVALPDAQEVLGVVSSSDLAHAIGYAAQPVLGRGPSSDAA